MRLAVAVCLTLVTAVVEARPSTVPADSPKLYVKKSANDAVKPRDLGDVLHNALNKHSSTPSSETSTTTPVTTSSSLPSAASSTNSSAIVSSSSSSSETTTSITPTQVSSPSSSSKTSTTSPSASDDNSSSSPLSLGSLLGGGSNPKASEDTKAETYGNDKITTYSSLGTTGDRVGFSWVPIGSSN